MAFNLDKSIPNESSDESFSILLNNSEKNQESSNGVDSLHALTIVSKLTKFLQEKILCDVVFVFTVGKIQHRIPAHRLVMATLSDYFRAMFESNMLETRQREIFINDVDPDAFEKLVFYAYKGRLDIDHDNVTDVLSAAHLFDINEVVETCCDFIEKQLHPSNALGIHKFAYQRNLSALTTKAWNYILEHFSRIVHNNHEFLDLTFDEIKQILASNDINVQSEEIVFEAFCAWVDHDPRRRNDRLSQLFGLIKLPLIEKKYLTDHIDTDPKFKDDPSCQILIIEAMRYHLAPERRSTLATNRTEPRDSTLGSLYCLGGMESAKGLQTIEKYDFRKRCWQVDGHLNSRRWQFACAMLNKKLYICGGRDGLKTLNSIEIFEFHNNTWSIGPPMITNRHGLGVASIGGTLYAIGGHDGWSFLKTVERYDPETFSWSYVASMTHARCTLGVAILENRIYAVGGRDGAAGLRETEYYDPHTNRWSSCAQMQKRRGAVAAVTCNGFLFAIGGHESSVTNKCAIRHDDGERYDPRCDQWTLITGLNRPKEALAITTVSNKIYVVGGFDGKVLDEFDEYDPQNDKWTKCSSLRTKRAGACLIHVSNAIQQTVVESPMAKSPLTLLTTSSYTIPSQTTFQRRSKDGSASCHQLSRLVL